VVYVLEVNPRASRTVPYVSKATGQQLAKIAARCMAGQKLADQTSLHGRAAAEVIPPYFSVKEAVFPFNKFPGVDPILGPEMRHRRGDGRGQPSARRCSRASSAPARACRPRARWSSR
jgi:carbamoyl-phosphate synthase large subunit